LKVGVDIGSRGVGDGEASGVGLGLPVGDGTGFGEGCGPAGGSWAMTVKDRAKIKNNARVHVDIVFESFL
jgi:hypothetical protein